MNKKLLIIGSKGMAGHVIYYYFKNRQGFDVVDISRSHDNFHSNYILDVNNTIELEKIIQNEKPDVIINCVGVLNKDAEDNPAKAIFLNSYLPHFLAKLATQLNCKLIHISTDCVFNGKKGKYTETDVKDGIGFYAQSKALGEVEYDQHLTIRTSIIGPELKKNGIGLFDWLMHQEGTIKGYKNAIWSGVTTTELAKAIEPMILQNITGLFQLANSHINKFDLLVLIKQTFEKTKVNILPFEEYSSDKSLISTRTDFKFELNAYPQMLTEMKNWIHGYPNLYP